MKRIESDQNHWLSPKPLMQFEDSGDLTRTLIPDMRMFIDFHHDCEMLQDPHKVRASVGGRTRNPLVVVAVVAQILVLIDVVLDHQLELFVALCSSATGETQ